VDDMDRAQEINEQHLADSLSRYRLVGLLYKTSARECVVCDEPIPEARRKAAPGCIRCRDCQELHETGGSRTA